MTCHVVVVVVIDEAAVVGGGGGVVVYPDESILCMSKIYSNVRNSYQIMKRRTFLKCGVFFTESVRGTHVSIPESVRKG